MHATPPLSFVHPYTKRGLQRDDEGNLFCEEDGRRQVFEPLNGCYDFVLEGPSEQSERAHYEAHYQRGSVRALDWDDIRGPWFDSCLPWYTTLLQSMGDLQGRTILLVGNGRSCKEFYFTACGAQVVFTDFSREAVLRASAEYDAARSILVASSTLRNGHLQPTQFGTIEFHAADANHLPFADESFDIVYGCAFVHHLEDLSPFLSEVRRVLKPGGVCRFWDQADSPLWSLLKRTILRPLQRYSHWRHPRSPEDIRANVRGGFNFPNLLGQMQAGQFRRLYFERQGFFLPIGLRHIGIEVNWNKRAMRAARPVFYGLRLLDAFTSWCHRISDNRLMLVWGFDK